MTPFHKRLTPITKRMAEDMLLRNMSIRTIDSYTEPFIAKHGKTTASQVASTLARLGFCRTAPMGGREYRCPSCETKCHV